MGVLGTSWMGSPSILVPEADLRISHDRLGSGDPAQGTKLLIPIIVIRLIKTTCFLYHDKKHNLVVKIPSLINLLVVGG
jgi:hypothetical protein